MRLFALIVLFCVVVFSGTSNGRGKSSDKSYSKPVSDEEYEILLQMAKGTFSVAVQDRTKEMKSARVKFWRKEGRWSFVGEELFLDGKKVHVFLFISIVFFNLKLEYA